MGEPPAFAPRAPWWGPDLQTLRNWLRRPRRRVPPVSRERLSLPLRDGSGELVISRPKTGSVTLFNRARVRLTQGTRAALTVAQDASLTPSSSDRAAEIDVDDADLAAFAVTGDFGALLDLDPMEALSGPWLVRVIFDAVVEVQP